MSLKSALLLLFCVLLGCLLRAAYAAHQRGKEETLNRYAKQFLRYFKQWWRLEPHLVVGDPDDPYMLRWWVIPRNPLLNIYIHKFLRDDDDRALHDHPWPSLSVLLRGRLREIVRMPQPCCMFNLSQGVRVTTGHSCSRNVPMGDFDRFFADHERIRKSLVVTNLDDEYNGHTCYLIEEYKRGNVVYRTAAHTHRLELFNRAPAWTLFITGPWERAWGFHCPKAWIPWRQFILGGNDPSSDGKANVGGGCPE